MNLKLLSPVPTRVKMYLVGLTGGIASGKSTVSAMLRELGCPIIDADLIARQVVQPHCPAYRLIVKHFGRDILLESGEIDREKLGAIIFTNPEKNRLLNTITHPEIQRAMIKQVLHHFLLGHRYVILDVPLLFETRRLTRFLKHTVVVYCDPDTQLSRLMARDSRSQDQAMLRIAAQLPLGEKVALANHVIDNSGSQEETYKQVLKLHRRLEDSLDFLLVRALVIAMATGIGGLIFLMVKPMIF